jgi:acyl dehydratase
VLQRPVYIGETLTTTTEVVALRQNRPKPGRDATGLAVLRVHVANQDGATVLDFWRCPMLPCRDPNAATGARDSLDSIPSDLDMDAVRAGVPSAWRLEAFRKAATGPHFCDVEPGSRFAVEAADTVTAAPELARLTMNLARAHTDAASSTYGRRLVYGGHTISMASAQVSRALPNLVTLLAWRSCDHLAPVFEGDRLRTDVEVVASHRLSGDGGLVDLAVRVVADRVSDAVGKEGGHRVLDWKLLALMA